MQELTLSSDFLEWLIEKAREFDVKDVSTGGADEEDVDASMLEDRGDDPVFDELVEAIEDLNDSQQAELVALFWMGRDALRGDSAQGSFEELVTLARNERVNRTSAYLLGDPLLSDYLAEGWERARNDA
ncbi:MAG: DUF3775 domain-containing protein [Pseudomonadota bacterium]